MAELQDLIDQFKEGNDRNRDHLREIERHSRNSRRHLLETKKEIFTLATNIAKMADIPPPPSEGEQTEQRREDQREQAKQTAALEKIAAGLAGMKFDPSSAKSSRNLLGMLGLGGAAAGLGAMATGLLKSAGGIVAMGVAIPAFFAGLLAGDAALSWLGDIGADFNYTALKSAALGFSDMIMSMDVKAFAVLASIMGISAVGGTKAALGLGAMGAAISAFFAGLLLGDAAISTAADMGWIDTNFTALGAAMAGISKAIENLSTEAAITLAAIIGATGVATLFSKKPTDVATGIAAVGAGISGFFVGLALGDAAMSWLGSDYTAIAAATEGFDLAIGKLTPASATALAALLGAGAIFGAITSKEKQGKMVLGIGALSLGIAAFFSGFAAADFVAANVGDGSTIVTLVKNFAEAIGALDTTSLTALSALLGAGAIFGAAPGGLMIAGKAAIGMGVIGAGIAAFFVAFEGVTKLAGVLGADGSGTKKLVTNLVEGIKPLNDLDGEKLAAAAKVLPDIGDGISSFFGGEMMGKLSETATDIAGFVKNIFGFGDDGATKEKSRIQKMVDALEPLKDIDAESMKGLNLVLDDLERLGKLRVDSNLGRNIDKFAEGLADGIGDLEFALYGGKRGKGKHRIEVRGLANGGQDLELAIQALNDIQAAATAGMVNSGTGGTTVINQTTNQGGSPTTIVSPAAGARSGRNVARGIGLMAQ
ncbi:MAG: hypothetical protein CMB73_02985 [Euryarchaeota archaeon]|nr:hypothetical protein [Euryarchaeota archaeon]|tara:strand:+ start:2676 stop:4802 length:2127 start_codon:yes stop_codon:yes gene_type:complete